MRKLVYSLFVLLLPFAVRGQLQPADIIGTLSVDVGRRGGENVLYKNGEKLDKSQARVLFSISPQALETLNKAYRNRAAGRSFLYTGSAVFGAGLGLLCSGEHPGASAIFALLGGGIAAVGIPFFKAYNRHSSAAADIYNRDVFRQAVPRRGTELSWGITPSGGVGLTLMF